MSGEAQQRAGRGAPPAGPFFEDFAVGRRIAAAAGRPPEGDAAAAPTTVLRLAAGTDVLPHSLLRVLETRWRNVSPAPAGEALEATFTVTACRRIAAEEAGSVQWHADVRDARGRTAQDGTITVLVPARPGSDGSADPVERAFCTRPWGEALARELADDAAFSSATATWDGAIGLRAGTSQIQLRIYRGQVIEVVPRTPLGATFTLEAAEHVWTDLLTGPSNDFFRRAMSGDSFTVTGNAYEYLRMSKAVMALVDAARTLATGATA
ncbi:hypothetical protein [Blastococcus sp. SYSU DS0539]